MKNQRFHLLNWLFFLILLLLTISCATRNQKYADNYYKEGMVFFNTMEYDRSIDSFSKSLTVDPENKENNKVYFMRGKSYYKIRKFDQAISDLTRAMDMTSFKDRKTRFLILETRGNAWMGMHQYANADMDFSQAVILDPENSNIKYLYNNRGWARHGMEQYNEAVEDFSEAISIDSSFDTAFYGKALSLYQLKDYEQAALTIKEAIRIRPENKAYDDLLFESKNMMTP